MTKPRITANRTLVLPIMAACLIGKAVSSLLSPTPIYRAFAGRLVEEYERQRQPTTPAGGPMEAGSAPLLTGEDACWEPQGTLATRFAGDSCFARLGMRESHPVERRDPV